MIKRRSGIAIIQGARKTRRCPDGDPRRKQGDGYMRCLSASARSAGLLRSSTGFGLLSMVFLLLGSGAAEAAIAAPERAALMDLYNATNGAAWIDSTGWGGATGSECAWHGVVCDVGQTTVLELHMDNNNLVGALPTTLGDLPNLKLFFAGNNLLSGSIPPLAGMVNLRNFAVGSNHLTGTIPALAGLTLLDYFDVGNNMLTGPIPALSDLTLLSRFDASHNLLSGPIPALDGLTNLQVMNVGDNHLSGSIPSLAGLTSLQDLYVKGNLLTGPPPLPPSPSALLASGSTLCPNYLDHAASADWDAATGLAPWYQNCPIDLIFANGFEAP
jgi:hypothetical protein